MTLSVELKAATDALTAEVALINNVTVPSTPDTDVQPGIDAIAAATAALQAKFPPA